MSAEQVHNPVNTIDAHIGQKIRWYRIKGRLRESEMVDLINDHPLACNSHIDKAAIEAFETGKARVSAADLFLICSVLKIRPEDLFMDLTL